MSLSLSLGLGLGSVATSQPRHVVAPDTVLCPAASQQVYVTLTYEGEPMTFAPLAVYEGSDGAKYVLGFQPSEGPGNRPPSLEGLPLSGLSNVVATETTFTIHPRHKPVLLGLQSVQCMVELV